MQHEKTICAKLYWAENEEVWLDDFGPRKWTHASLKLQGPKVDFGISKMGAPHFLSFVLWYSQKHVHVRDHSRSMSEREIFRERVWGAVWGPEICNQANQLL